MNNKFVSLAQSTALHNPGSIISPYNIEIGTNMETKCAFRMIDAQKEVAVMQSGLNFVQHISERMPRTKFFRFNVYRGAFTGGIRTDIESH